MNRTLATHLLAGTPGPQARVWPRFPFAAARLLVWPARLLFLGSLVLAACSNSPYPASDRTRKVIYLPFLEAPKTLDPAVAYDTAAHEVTGNVYATLLEYHYLERPYRLIPGLAQQVPEPESLSDGKVRYRFELRPDLLYQPDPCFALSGPGRDTRRVVAADVAFELCRIADPSVNSPVVEPFSNLEGFSAFSQRLLALRTREPGFARLRIDTQYARAGGIEGVRVEGERWLELVLARPYPQLLYWFAMPFTAPVPWEAVTYYDGQQGRPRFADHPVGAGPFLLAQYDKQSRIVLAQNPNWHGLRHPEWKAPGAVYPATGEPDDRAQGRLGPEVVGRPLPLVERVEYRREKEAIPSFNKFLQGYYDASGVIRESFDRVIKNDRLSPEMAALGIRLDKSVSPAIYYIGFNMSDPTVGAPGGERSRRLRQAMSLCADVEEYTRVFLNGRGVPAQSPLPPGIFGYEPGYRNPYRRVDLGRARQLLTEAGYPGGVDPATHRPLRLTFDVPDTSADGRLRYLFWVNQWRRLGIQVELSATNYNQFQEKVRQGSYQIFLWGWVADYPDPENFLFLLWSEMARSKNNGPNTANFSDPEFDRLFVEMKSRPDDARKLELIRNMRSILERERPWIELFHPEDYTLYHGWLTNVKAPGLSLPTAKYHDLRAELRAERRLAWNRPVLWPGLIVLLLGVLLAVPAVLVYLRERS